MRSNRGREVRRVGERPGRKEDREITELQKATLAAVREHVETKGFPPTLVELAHIRNIATATAHDQLTQLVRKGYLRRTPNKARSLEVVKEPEIDVPELISVPILGRIAAGRPTLAIENRRGEILVEGRTIGRSPCFALQVKGDSMIRVGIRDGDYVVARQQPIAENGDIVVALVGAEATVKRLRISENGIALCPENPKFEPIPVGPKDELRIVGKVVAVRRAQKA